jgi:hypothetical protein
MPLLTDTRPEASETPDAALALAAGRIATAEIAECTCPEPCERDHDVD